MKTQRNASFKRRHSGYIIYEINCLHLTFSNPSTHAQLVSCQKRQRVRNWCKIPFYQLKRLTRTLIIEEIACMKQQRHSYSTHSFVSPTVPGPRSHQWARSRQAVYLVSCDCVSANLSNPSFIPVLRVLMVSNLASIER